MKFEVGAQSHDDQALAKLFTERFECGGWTQGELAQREGRSQAWVTFRLRFGRFLHFTARMVAKPDSLVADLTERRFRALWAQTDKSAHEELRFHQIIKLLCVDEVTFERHPAQVRNTLDDEQLVALWRTRETCPDIARRLGVNPTWLRLQWRRLRYNGKIPKDGRRNARVIREDDDDAANDHLDGRPGLAARDRLLRRLITVHNERGSTYSPATKEN
jgi:hypothetical protein